MGRVINLDAARREAGDEPEPIVLILGGMEYELPPELPAAVFDPIIEGELDALLVVLVEVYGEGDERAGLDLGRIVEVLRASPQVLSGTLRTLRGAYAGVLGPQQWQTWLGARPSVGDYLRFGKAALAEYGVGLGEAWGFSPSSANGGTTSKRTSAAGGRTSTRAGSGTRRGTRS